MKKILASMIIFIEVFSYCATGIVYAIETNDVSNEVEETSQESTANDVEENEIIKDNITETKENITNNIEEEKTNEINTTNEIKDGIDTIEGKIEEQKEELISLEGQNIETILENDEANNENNKFKDITFEYNGNPIQIHLTEEELGVNLDDYHYYMVNNINDTTLDILYSIDRLYFGWFGNEGWGWLYGGKNTINVKIDIKSGSITKSIKDIKSNRVGVTKTLCIATNQNIYYGNNIIITKNSGYEYDTENEAQETSSELVRLASSSYNQITTFEKPALCYDTIANIQVGTVVKRIKKKVNEIDGIVWDKIELSDGRTVYIDTQYLEKVTEEEKVKEIKFMAENNMYKLYFSSKEIEENLDNYRYYMVNKINDTTLDILYSIDRLYFGWFGNEGWGWLYGGKNTINVKIDIKNGSITKSIKDIKSNRVGVTKTECVSSNQNIYCGNNIVISKNSGYEYDIENETQETINEYVRVVMEGNSSALTFDKPSLSYDQIAALQVGTVVKRIKKKVNEIDGIVWDKIELSDGRAVYIDTRYLEKVTEEEKVKEIKFMAENNMYKLYFSSREVEANLDDYNYYIVNKVNDTTLEVWYSNSRLWSSLIRDDGSGYMWGGNKTVYVNINIKNSSIKREIKDIKSKSVAILTKNCVSTNQNIYYGEKKVISKNSGYEYDIENEKQEISIEFVRLVSSNYNEITTFDKPALCYDPIAYIQVGTVVKRIKKKVNEVDGIVWDKIELSNGEEVYVDSSYLEEVAEEEKVKGLDFEVNNKIIIMYFTSKELEVNIDDYHYYMVNKIDSNTVELWYSTDRFYFSYFGDEGWGWMWGGPKTIYVKLDIRNGSITKTIKDIKSKSTGITKSNCIATNQNIYCGNNILIPKNSGYEYNIENEKTEMCNELVKGRENTDIVVFEKPAFNYDVITKIQSGIIIKRIKKSVNNIDGCMWDKVELSDGSEGYVESKYLEILDDTNVKEISFECNKKKYTVYLAQISIDVDIKLDINDYKHYVVRKSSDTEFEVYCSIREIKTRHVGQGDYAVYGEGNTILFKIGTNGAIRKTIMNFYSGYIRLNDFKYITSDQDIYKDNIKIFSPSKSIYAVKAYLRYNNINDFNDTIDEIYTDNYYMAIKEFQSEMIILPFKGELDDNTYNAMGLNDNANFEKYLKIGNNYNLYESPYGPKYYDNIPNSDTRFEIGRTRAEFKSQEYYNEQESRYNSMSYEDRMKKGGSILATEVTLIEILKLSKKVYPHAYLGLSNFLYGNGETLYIEDVEVMFEYIKNSNDLRNKYIEQTPKAVEHMLTIDENTNFSIEKAISVTLPNSNKNEIDWFGLYGTYLFSVEGTCSKNGSNYKLTGNCHVRDYYDFDDVNLAEYIGRLSKRK